MIKKCLTIATAVMCMASLLVACGENREKKSTTTTTVEQTKESNTHQKGNEELNTVNPETPATNPNP